VEIGSCNTERDFETCTLRLMRLGQPCVEDVYENGMVVIKPDNAR